MAEGQRQEKRHKGKRKVARENPERVGRVARQDTLQLGARKEETKTCTPQTTVKSQLRMRRICRHGGYWKRLKMSSGRR